MTDRFKLKQRHGLYNNKLVLEIKIKHGVDLTY